MLLRCWSLNVLNKLKNVIIVFMRTGTSIHPFSIPSIRRSGRGGAGAYPSVHRAKGGVHPGQVASPSQGHIETNNHTLTPKDNLE